MLHSTEIIAICSLNDNYIWMILNKKSKSAWVVDPGEATPVLKSLKQHDLPLSGIIITHHHHDHSGGVRELLHTYGEIPVYGSYRSTLPFITHPIKEGNEIVCADITLRAIEIPGHTLDHTAFFGNHWLFSGDTLFSAGCGRIFEGTPQQMYQSLQKLMDLPDDTAIFCGHEYTLANLKFAQHVEPDNIAITKKYQLAKAQREHNQPTLPSILREEKTYNPFLRCKEPAVIRAVEHYAGHKLETEVQVFEKLRQWKSESRA